MKGIKLMKDFITNWNIGKTLGLFDTMWLLNKNNVHLQIKNYLA